MRIRARQLALSIFAALAALSQVQAAPGAAPPRPVLITADKVWTGEGAPHAGWSVLVAQGRIQAVGPAGNMTVPADAERISLPGKTLIPGMIDLHSHVLLHPYNETTWDDQVIKEPVAYRIMLAGRHAAATLQAGFTTLRDLGTEGADYADVGIKRAIERLEEAAIAGPIAQATRQEKQAAAARSASKAVSLRLAGEQVVALVGSFLEQRWTPVLTLAYTIEDGRPGAVDNATRAMDDLIWSVKPKATQEQRKALIKRLPGLLTTLNKWLDATGWQDAERLQFFAALADCHATIVRAPIELSPERQLELAVEAAQQDALRRIAQEQAGAVEEQAPLDPASAAVAGLERGMRVEFSGALGVRKVRLAWVSPLRTLFIFSGARRQEAFSLPAERLLDAFRTGSIRVLAAEGVVGRVLTQAVGAVNDAQAPDCAA